MGNCICVTNKTTGQSFNNRRRRRTSTVCHEGGDDDDDDDRENLIGEKVTSSCSSSSCVKREIKIRMTKKELEDLMRNIDMKTLTVEEMLSKLIFDGGDQLGFAADHHRPWRPALQSIPEMD